MALTNNLKKQIDLPVWEWLRFAPVATSATSSACAGEGLNERYLYFLSTTFWRYDTWSDTWQQLATPPTAPVTGSTMRYSSYGGYRGNILDATSTTAKIAGLERDIFSGATIRIMAGTGAGQDRVISSMTDSTTCDHGVVTTASAVLLTDTAKRWRINQWIGYQVRIVFNTGQSQVRKILYNDLTTIYLQDVNYQQLEPWNNTPFSATAPYALPVATAGSQAHYFIESSNITISTPWDVVPDASSSYVIMTGGIWLLSAAAAAPWSSFQYYDVISDTWIPKTALGGLLLGALGTDFTIERTGEAAGTFLTGTATGGSATTLVDSSKTLSTNRYRNHQIRITGGTGFGQRRKIVGNLANTFTIEGTWDINPDATSTYSIYGNTDRIFMLGNGASTLYKYSVETDCWFISNNIDVGQARNISISYKGQEPFGMTTGVRNAGGITAVAEAPTAGGTGYIVGDILTVTTGGTLGKVRVKSVSAGGVVTGVEVFSAGATAYTIGTGKATTVVAPGVGTGCTINITSVGVVGYITTTSNHNLAVGDAITISGCTEAAWNGNFTIFSADTANTFNIQITATANAAASSSQSTTVLVDASKNWEVDKHIGELVIINTAGPSPTTQIRRIVSNTATTLTLQSAITAAVNGTSRFVLQEPQAFGRDEQYKVTEQSNNGYATGGTTTTLIDSSKNWLPNQWANYKFRIECGVGNGTEITITGNTATTLSFSTQTFTPDTSTRYLIMDTYGLCTSAGTTTTIIDTTKNWTVNQWAGKRVRITSGAGQCQEATILSNTATVLTTAAAMAVASGVDSTYTIFSIPPRGTGIEMNWIFGNSVSETEGKYIICPRGSASNIFDRYDITTGAWESTVLITPQSETLTTGSMYAYDGANRLYFTRDATGRVFYLDVNTLKVDNAGMTPYAHGAALLGNRMEMFKTADGLTYLYIMRHTGQEMWRSIIFW